MSILESVASSRRKTKENVRIEGLIPSQLRDDASVLTEVLNSYYEFMNLFGYYYKKKDVIHYATVINGEILFRAESGSYFYDFTLHESKVFDSRGNEIVIDQFEANILGTDNLPDALEDDETTYGTLFFIEDPIINSYDFQQLTLVTPTIIYVGDSPSYAINNILEQRDIDTINSKYLEMIQREIAASIPRSLQSDKKLLYKNITQFYRDRGSEESIKVFFQILLNDLVEIEYPANDMFIPSSGNWDPNSPATLPQYDLDGNIIGYVPGFGKYLDKGGFLSDTKKLQDSFFYQKFSYLIKTGSNLSTWSNAFNKLIHPAGFKFFGQIILFIELLNQRNSIMPLNQPGLIGLEDLALVFEIFSSITTPIFDVKIHRNARIGSVVQSGGVIERVEFADTGYGYTVAPTINITDDSGINATFTTTLDEFGSIITIKSINGFEFIEPDNGGSGYISPVGTIDINPNGGSIATVTQLSKGFKYTGNVSIQFDESPLGVTATATAILTNGRVSGVTITNSGTGYTTNPRIYIVPDVGIKKDFVAEFLPILILSFENSNKYKEEIADRWENLTKFYDNTNMYTFADYTIEQIESGVFRNYLNVGTEIYSQPSLDPISFTPIENKLAQDHL